MGGVVSGAAYPALANRVITATAAPYMLSLFAGGRWYLGWAVTAFVQLLYVATNGWAPADDPTLRGDPIDALQAVEGTRFGYFVLLGIILPIVFSLLGWFHARVSFASLLPYHLFPLAHIGDCRPAHCMRDDAALSPSGVGANLVIGSWVVWLLVGASSFVPYEIAQLYAPAEYVPWVGAFAPAAGVIVFAWAPWLACGPRSGVLGTRSGGVDGKAFFKAWGVCILLALLVAPAQALAAYYMADFDWTWTAGAVVAVVFLIFGVAMSMRCSSRSSTATTGQYNALPGEVAMSVLYVDT